MKSEGISQPLFYEEQSFNQLWMKVFTIFVFLCAFVFIAISSYVQLYRGIPFGNNPFSNFGLVLYDIFLVVLCVTLHILLRKVKLTVTLDSKNMHVRFWPIVDKVIPLDEIVSFEAITYRPIRDYGGWGFRYSLKKKHWAYNVSGNRGVLFEFKNGKKLLIGSQYPSKIVMALSKLKKPQPPASSADK